MRERELRNVRRDQVNVSALPYVIVRLLFAAKTNMTAVGGSIEKGLMGGQCRVGIGDRGLQDCPPGSQSSTSKGSSGALGEPCWVVSSEDCALVNLKRAS